MMLHIEDTPEFKAAREVIEPLLELIAADIAEDAEAGRKGSSVAFQES